MIRDTRAKKLDASARIIASVNGAFEQLRSVEDRLAAGTQELRAAFERVEELEARLAATELSLTLACEERDAVTQDLAGVQLEFDALKERFLNFTRAEIENTRKEIDALSALISRIQSGRAWRIKALVNRVLRRKPLVR